MDLKKAGFGEILEWLLFISDIKQQTIAANLNYDASYISKWISGKALPSQRNISEIISEIARIISEESSPENITKLRKSLLIDFDVDLNEGIK